MSKMSKSVIWILRKWVWKRVLNNRGFLAKSDRSVLDHRFFFFFFFFFFGGGGVPTSSLASARVQKCSHWKQI